MRDILFPYSLLAHIRDLSISVDIANLIIMMSCTLPLFLENIQKENSYILDSQSVATYTSGLRVF